MRRNSRPDDPFRTDQFWTRSGRARARLARALSAKTCELQAKPSVGLEPTTPSLPWKVQGFTSVHGRSPTGTNCLQTAAIRSARQWSAKPARVRTSGRKTDGKLGPGMTRILVPDGSRSRAAGDTHGPPSRGEVARLGSASVGSPIARTSALRGSETPDQHCPLSPVESRRLWDAHRSAIAGRSWRTASDGYRKRGKGIARPEQPREPKQSWRAQAPDAWMGAIATPRQVCWPADSQQAQSRLAWARAVPRDCCDLDHPVVASPGGAEAAERRPRGRPSTAGSTNSGHVFVADPVAAFVRKRLPFRAVRRSISWLLLAPSDRQLDVALACPCICSGQIGLTGSDIRSGARICVAAFVRKRSRGPHRRASPWSLLRLRSSHAACGEHAARSGRGRG
jgi:hypothetical protein